MATSDPDLAGETQGVHTVRQERSRRSRDAFIESGFALLNESRFTDLSIAALARHCNRSVGAFYKRFADKEGYFRALQIAAVARGRKIIRRRLAPERLAGMSREDVLDELVDLLSDIFSSRVRGVLRESLLRVLDPEDGWAPMRESGREIQQVVVARLKAAWPDLGEDEAERKIRFCYQIIVGVLQNDLVNDFHTFTSRDRSLRKALKAAVKDHMHGPSRY